MARPVTPGPVVIPNAAEVKLFWRNTTHNWSNVLHVAYSGAPSLDAAFAETLFSGFKSGLSSSAWSTFLSAETEFTGVGVKDIRQANMTEYLSTGAPVAGGDVTGPLPLNMAVVVTIVTAQSGAGFRGRVYLGGLGTTAQGSATAASAPAGAAAVAFVQAIDSTLGSNQIPLGVGQRSLNAGKTAAGADMPPRPAFLLDATGFRITNNRFDSQRRRLGR